MNIRNRKISKNLFLKNPRKRDFYFFLFLQFFAWIMAYFPRRNPTAKPKELQIISSTSNTRYEPGTTKADKNSCVVSMAILTIIPKKMVGKIFCHHHHKNGNKNPSGASKKTLPTI